MIVNLIWFTLGAVCAIAAVYAFLAIFTPEV